MLQPRDVEGVGADVHYRPEGEVQLYHHGYQGLPAQTRPHGSHVQHGEDWPGHFLLCEGGLEEASHTLTSAGTDKAQAS